MRTLPLFLALLLLGATSALEAAAPVLPSYLTGRYAAVRATGTLNGTHFDAWGFAVPVTIKRDFLNGIEDPKTLQSILKVLQKDLRKRFPDARLTSQKTSSRISLTSGGYTYARNDKVFVSIPSVHVGGNGTSALTGTLVSPGRWTNFYRLQLVLHGPGGTQTTNITLKLVYEKNGG
jgi:hypothetical protein